MRRPSVLYRRSRHVVSFWDDGKLLFRNVATGVTVSARPAAAEILDHFEEWQSAEQFFEEMPGHSRSSLRKALSQLVKATLLLRSDRPSAKSETALDAWGPWNPEVGFLHMATKDGNYDVDLERNKSSIAERMRLNPPPPPIKRYREAETVELPGPECGGDFVEVLLARRTWRRFSDRPLALSDLGTLLGLTFGVQSFVDLETLGIAALRTSPSGGARHPIEAYVLARKVRGLASGLYHYASDEHCLERLKRRASSRDLVAYLGGQWWYKDASALVLMTAVFERSLWRYPSARAYRTVHLEAGHFCQTFCLVATSLGLAPFCSAALADSRIENDIEVDGFREAVLYAAGVGARPTDAGKEWSPFPDQEVPPKRLELAKWEETFRRRTKRR